MEADLSAMLKRHEAFWSGSGRDPLVEVTPHVPLKDQGGIPLADGRIAREGELIRPDMIEPRRFVGEGPGGPRVGKGDFMAGTTPPALCWTEAIAGCPVRVVTGGPWAEPFFEVGGDPAKLMADERWLGKLDAFVDLLAERAKGRYPVGQPLFRGPVDIMAAALGHEAMCSAFLEAPGWTDAFLEACGRIFLRAAERRLSHTPRFEGGYLSGYGIWAPGSVVRTQVDNATLLSPKVYRERVLPHDRRVIEAFDFPLIHLHSICLHIVEDLLQVPGLKAIQVSIDYPGGPLASEVMPILRRILREKPLIVTGPVTEAELAALRALQPAGRLCLQAQLVT